MKRQAHLLSPAGLGPGGRGLGRPRLMHLTDCERVTFSRLTYKNPASCARHLINCRNVRFDAVTIDCQGTT